MLRDKQNKKNSGQQLPVFPAWVYERPTLVGDFLTGSSLSSDVALPIGMSCLHSLTPRDFTMSGLHGDAGQGRRPQVTCLFSHAVVGRLAMLHILSLPTADTDLLGSSLAHLVPSH